MPSCCGLCLCGAFSRLRPEIARRPPRAGRIKARCKGETGERRPDARMRGYSTGGRDPEQTCQGALCAAGRARKTYKMLWYEKNICLRALVPSELEARLIGPLFVLRILRVLRAKARAFAPSVRLYEGVLRFTVFFTPLFIKTQLVIQKSSVRTFFFFFFWQLANVSFTSTYSTVQFTLSQRWLYPAIGAKIVIFIDAN